MWQNLKSQARSSAMETIDSRNPRHHAPPQNESRSGGVTPASTLGEASLAGNRKAVLVGINYRGQKGELRGCINDVDIMTKGLQKHGFQQENMHILTEDSSISPTRANILSSLRWLVNGARSGDTLFFHYSGHGTRTKDKDGDEDDGYDEAICPLDYDRAGLIIDDELHNLIVKPLPKGCRLTSLMDCCHSGSALDLPYGFVATEEVTRRWKLGQGLPTMQLGALIQKAVHAATDNLRSSRPLAGGIIGNFADRQVQQRTAHRSGGNQPSSSSGPQAITQKFADCEAILFSGCMDTQTSADVADVSKFGLPTDTKGAGGACTSAFCEALLRNPNISFIALLEDIRQNLASKRFTQVPQLTSTCNIPLDAQFKIVP